MRVAYPVSDEADHQDPFEAGVQPRYRVAERKPIERQDILGAHGWLSRIFEDVTGPAAAANNHCYICSRLCRAHIAVSLSRHHKRSSECGLGQQMASTHRQLTTSLAREDGWCASVTYILVQRFRF